MMRCLCRATAWGAVVVLCCAPSDSVDPTPQAHRKVAVLVAAEMAEPVAVTNNIEFWTDTVLVYCMLRRNGFSDENIYVLYGDGTDGFGAPPSATPEQADIAAVQSANGDQAPGATVLPDPYTPEEYCSWLPESAGGMPETMTDFPMTLPDGSIGCTSSTGGAWECRPWTVLNCLAVGCDEPKIPKLGAGDQLLVWWKGHGSQRIDPTSNLFTGDLDLTVGADSLGAEDLALWVDRTAAHLKVLVLESCQSGCLANTLAKSPSGETHVVLLSSCTCGESSYPTDRHDAKHGIFSFWVSGTLAALLPPGAKNPMNEGTEVEHLVNLFEWPTVQEALAEASKATTYEDPMQTPTMGGASACAALKLKDQTSGCPREEQLSGPP